MGAGVEVTNAGRRTVGAPLPERPRVMALEWNLPFHIDVASRLAERYRWNFVYWVGDGETFGSKVRERFPDIVFHDTVDARYGRPPKALVDLQPRPFDEKMARMLAYEKALVLKMMDRIELEESFGFRDRVRLFHHLASWWEALLDYIKPDVMMIPTAPHVVYDYIAYALCRHRGIRTAMFENASIPGWLLPTPVFEDGFPNLISTYRVLLSREHQDTTVRLSLQTEDYLSKTRGAYVKPHEMKRFEKIYNQPSPSPTANDFRLLGKKVLDVNRYPRYLRHIVDATKRKLARSFGVSIRSRRRISGFYHGRFLVLGEATPRDEAQHSKWVAQRLLQLKQDYDLRADPVDLSAKFIYVPLHVQPERSTSPNGGIYDHTELMVEALARTIPVDWLIYIKEHPSQFAPWQVGERGRRLSDYAAMAALPNTRLVPLDSNPFDLIDNARAVATITGTSGWEAIARGIPVLCFGIAWYQGCDGVFDVRRSDNLRAAIQAIIAGSKPSLHRIRLFLRATETVGIRAFSDEEAREVSQLSEADNVVAISEGLAAMVADSEPAAKEEGLVLRPAVKADARLLHEWRNDPETRRNSRHSEIISWETHEAWFAESLVSAERAIWICEERSQPVGVVRADANPNGWELSWTVAPEARGRGLGSQMLKQFVTTLDGSLVAVIRAGNTPSAKIAAAAGLVRVGPADHPEFEKWASGVLATKERIR
jgi:RimJ/RimL family protein N-acetyltransferase